MKFTIPLICIFLFTLGCKKNPSDKKDSAKTDVHKIFVKESIQSSNYTFVRASENDTDKWIAIPSMNLKTGEIYYYTGGLMMLRFKSKELNRTFDHILFLEGLRKEMDPGIRKLLTSKTYPMMEEKHQNVNTSNLRRIPIKLKPAKDGMTIAILYAHKDRYAGKIVQIKGIVTKFSPDIMKRNWIHLQDGTKDENKFDLTITTGSRVSQGDTVTFEGKITLQKDFGFGYSYELLMEDATILQ